MGGGAWPFLVRGVICLVDSDNERDSYQVVVLGLTALRSVVLVSQTCVHISRCAYAKHAYAVTHGQTSHFKTPTGTGGDSSRTKKSNNRSVMPLDVLGCTRATLKCTTSNGNAAVRVAVRQKHGARYLQ